MWLCDYWIKKFTVLCRYPNPSAFTYEKRLFCPFEYALQPPPWYKQEHVAVNKPELPVGVSDLKHYDGPQCFIIPGNHGQFSFLSWTSHKFSPSCGLTNCLLLFFIVLWFVWVLCVLCWIWLLLRRLPRLVGLLGFCFELHRLVWWTSYFHEIHMSQELVGRVVYATEEELFCIATS